MHSQIKTSMAPPRPCSFLTSLKSHHGFTLVEMAVVMVIIGIVISIIATIMPSLLNTAKTRKAQAVIEKVDYTMQGYIASTGRCPCPDTDNDGNENRNDGGTTGDPSDDTCAQYVGDLPYRTIGLTHGDDVWGNKIKYGVYEDMIKTTSNTGSNPICKALTDIIKYYDPLDGNNPPDTSKLYSTDPDGNNKNIAYILVSGGPKDLDQDGSDGFFDGLNEGSDLQFDHPDRIQFHGSPTSARYDDIVSLASFTYLSGKTCSGLSGSAPAAGPGYAAGENTYPNGCTDATDNDGDGYIDCDDQDCYGIAACAAGGANVTCVTTVIPSGIINSTYTATLQARGGITPYEWSFIDTGGFSDLQFPIAYNGKMEATLDQCPGTYNIVVEVKDSTLVADGGPKTATCSYTLEVTSNLTLARTSGDRSTSITWSSANQKETFKLSGGLLGIADWTATPVDWGGATGFSLASTGNDTCEIKKSGTTTAGPYTLVITAADNGGCPANKASLNLNVNVLGTGTGARGDITGVIDSLEFDTSYGRHPAIINVSGDVYAIAYMGPGNDGWLKTIEISDSGSIVNPLVDSLEFDPSYAYDLDIIELSPNYFAICYRGGSGNDDGIVKTIKIESDGNINSGVIDTLVFNNNRGMHGRIINISGDVYAIAYRGPGNDGWIETVGIDSTGHITNSEIDSLEFDTSYGIEPDIIHVVDDIYAIAYYGPGNDGFLKTVKIASDGSIDNAVIDTLEFDPSYGVRPSIVKVTDDVFAIAYRGPGNDGFVKTMQIDSSGEISSVISTFEFDTGDGLWPKIINMSGGVFAIAYTGPGTDGWIKTIEIADDGQINPTVLDSLEFDNNYGYEVNIIKISDGVYGIVYRGPGNDGWLKTIGLSE